MAPLTTARLSCPLEQRDWSFVKNAFNGLVFNLDITALADDSLRRQIVREAWP